MLRQTALFAVAPLLIASAAQAVSPWEAAELARDLDRPTTSYLKLIDQAQVYGLSQVPTRLFAPGGAPMGIFLNRFATEYSCGDDDAASNVSSVVCGSDGAIGGFSGSTTQWNSLLSCVQDQFEQFNVFVTDVEPAQGEYIEAMVGGSPQDAGMPFGVGGVAPFSCGVIPGAVVYAFADVYGNAMQSLCETVAQEVAHAFGLDHELLCEDPMTYLDGCGAKSFKDEYASCGEFEPRQCSCDIPSQNSVQMMLERLGPNDGSEPPPPPDDNEDPIAELLSPADGDVLQSNSTIVVEATVSDDVGLSIVELEWDFTGEAMFCPGTNGAWNCQRTGTTATWTIQVGEGARTFRVHVRDAVGNEVTTEDRTIYLTADGVTPPSDTEAPTVMVLTPRNGAIAPANSPLQVVALVGDDQGLTRVELEWPYNGETFLCPSQTDGVECAIDGNTYRWTLQVGQGERPFRIRALDLAGNVTRTDEAIITLVPNVDVTPDDGNDTPQDAVPLACGEEIALEGLDADWLDVQAPEGQDVTVLVEGADASLVATNAEGTEVRADGTGSLDFTSEGTTKVAVLPASASGGAVTVSVSCEAATARQSKGRDGGAVFGDCAQAGPAMAPLLALLGLVRRRPRRRG